MTFLNTAYGRSLTGLIQSSLALAAVDDPGLSVPSLAPKQALKIMTERDSPRRTVLHVAYVASLFGPRKKPLLTDLSADLQFKEALQDVQGRWHDKAVQLEIGALRMIRGDWRELDRWRVYADCLDQSGNLLLGAKIRRWIDKRDGKRVPRLTERMREAFTFLEHRYCTWQLFVLTPNTASQDAYPEFYNKDYFLTYLLQPNPRLQYMEGLMFERGHIGPHIAKEIAQYALLPRLRRIDARENFLGGDGVRALLESPRSPSLESLDARENGIPEREKASLKELAKQRDVQLKL